MNVQTNISAVSGYLKHLQKGWVGNRLSLSGTLPKNKQFAAIFPHQNGKLGLEGCVTWGKTGFSFTADLDKKIQPKISTKKHRGCSLSNQKMTSIAKEIINKSINKIDGIEFQPRSQSKEPLLQARVKLAKLKKPLHASKSNLLEARKKGFFDKEFTNFVTKHLKNGLICSMKKKSKLIH